jgi:endonuclease/exonuclease/phosphatase family metal-dependent hydrolase
MRRRPLVLVSAPLAALLALSVGTLPAEGAAAARKKAAAAAPARAVTGAAGVANGVRISWRPAPRATRYRVKWAFAPWDKWPSTTRYSAWLPASARSNGIAVSTDPAHDRTMTAVQYGNPVFARVQTGNGSRLGPWSPYRAIWPKLPQPKSGDAVRLGTYNVMLAGRTNWARRMPRIAQNIAARNLNMVALQETMNTNASGIASRLTALTHHTWKVATTVRVSEGRILYDATRFSVRTQGLLNNYSPSGQSIHSYRTGKAIPTPYARFRAVGSSRTFTVVSVHFGPSNPSTQSRTSNKQTGATARAVLAALGRLTSSSEPAVIAGDFAAGYGVWGDQNPPQPTLVRAGWWDAMASQSRLGVRYSTTNGRRVQRPNALAAGRADGIFLRGIHGTSRYVNVYNFFMPGSRVPPSDHNLVYGYFQVPR